jgi:NAD(P)-dependent dehydrogenase (short-subunit alcohol dehydrogenase family)
MGDGSGALAGKVALVAGGTRGGGRGIAVELGAAGATVYVTGRSSASGRAGMDRPETIEETAAQVTEAGGTGISVRTDHSDPGQVQALADRIAAEQDGRLDILVNSVWGGDPLADWEHPLWEQDLDNGLRLLRQAVETHVITSRFALPLMVARRRGLVVEVTDGNTARYRGSFFYDLAKSAVIRLAVAQAAERGELAGRRGQGPELRLLRDPALPGPRGRGAGRRPRRAGQVRPGAGHLGPLPGVRLHRHGRQPAGLRRALGPLAGGRVRPVGRTALTRGGLTGARARNARMFR